VAGGSSGSSRRGTGIIQKAAETAGAAVGSVAGAARSAAASFREGVAEGEMAGDRDVDRAAVAVETGRERISDTAAAVTAPITGLGHAVTGHGHGHTSEGGITHSVRVTEGGMRAADDGPASLAVGDSSIISGAVQPTGVRFADQENVSSSGSSSIEGTGGTGSALGGSPYESAGPMASAAETGGINGVSGEFPVGWALPCSLKLSVWCGNFGRNAAGSTKWISPRPCCTVFCPSPPTHRLDSPTCSPPCLHACPMYLIIAAWVVLQTQ
jgi:hypothetical protein